MKRRKGAGMPFEMIVLLLFMVIAIVIVGLIFLPKILKDDLTSRELCKLSIIERATVPEAFLNAIPLRCTTDKICISNSGKKDACRQFAGEEGVKGVKLTGDRFNQAKIIERESANAMFDCWEMTGRGKLDIFSSGSTVGNLGSLFNVEGLNFDVKQPKCIICNRVAIAEDVCPGRSEDFDPSVFTAPDDDTENNCVLDDVDINSYLRTKQVPNSRLTYLQTFTDQSINSYSEINKKDDSYGIVGKTNQLAFVFMQIKSPTSPRDAFADVAVGGLAVGGGGLLTSTGRVVAKTVGGWPFAVAYLAGVGATAGYAAYTEDQSQLVSAAYCGSFTSEDEENARQGCSLIRGVNWDADTVNKLCKGGIEGGP